MKSSKPIIAVDNDDVLFELVESIFLYYNATYKTEFKISQQRVFNLESTFRLSEEETMDRIFDFYKSEFFMQTRPMPGAHQVLQKLSIQFDLVLVTNRPNFTKKVTIQALNQHYPKLFKAIYLTNAFSKTGKKQLKSEVCQKIGAQILIDDAFHNAEDCAGKGIPVILFRRPWNKSLTAKDFKGQPIYPAKNWVEVQKIIKSMPIKLAI